MGMLLTFVIRHSSFFPMSLRVLDLALVTNPLTLRIPFRYGIVTLTEVPHLFACATVEIDGQVAHGVAADNLIPKWFTKNPATSFRDDLAEIIEVLRHASAVAVEVGRQPTVFALWKAVHEAQKVWGTGRKYPPLLWNFGVSIVERAVIDAFCRTKRTTFAQAVRTDAFAIDYAAVHPELAGAKIDFLPETPLPSVIARHTVGLTDPLTVAEIPTSERVLDGLPQALEECIERYGLTHFKIKLGGDIERDRERLRALAALLDRLAPGCQFTLDGNENYRDVAPFRALWEQLLADPVIARFLRRLIFVEQPLHRDVALTAETGAALRAWTERPPIIIDESGGELHAVPTALAAGYAGSSHKNCKGVIHGLADAALIAHRRRMEPGRTFHLSGEDLTNLGPVAMLQDLAVAATLGIEHVERNGHHYFCGLSQFPASVQRAALAQHGDLYRQHERGFPVLRVEGGKVSVRSVLQAPFGSRVPIDPAEFEAL
jgi:hypothetical protein